MSKILVLHGPNLNLLGQREPDQYGCDTLDDINRRLQVQAVQAGHDLACFQSNAESQLIERIHLASRESIDFIIFNPAAFTHTSIALRDALGCVSAPFIEVHISNVYKREAFRHHSYFSDIAMGVICGLGSKGYDFALQVAVEHLTL